MDDLSFEVYPGESIAVLGRNGSGKSTTLKLLSGVLRPSAGWIGTQGRVAGLLEVGAGFHPNLTGRENVYLNAAILGMSRQETDERFEQILEFSEIGEFIDTEVKRYSSGMYSRLGFSVAVHTELDVLLVDEILSVGDAPFRAKCNDKIAELQDQGKTMFIVSHNAAQVKKLCQRGIVLEKGKKVFDGAIGEAVALMNPKKAGVPKPAAQKPGVQKSGAQKPATQKPAAQQKPAGDQGSAARQHIAGKPAATATESASKSTPTTVQQTAQSPRGPMQQAPVQQEPVQQESLQPKPARAPVPGSLQHRLATQNHRDSEEPPVREVSEPASKRARHGA
ncbi:ABC transporter ATP-binding protein [Leucobacter sp. Psy1]|uniref:ABC transporter ATP-binding protein n=1 Tax=Leucobacter sp. Psy1 TaxID=2875729 RepID=UPI001CD63837|nr:ABC transporter ATP-binding protein [Leucobacter sp. Psy1]